MRTLVGHRAASALCQPEVPSTREQIAPPRLPDSVADERLSLFWENAMYQPKVPITNAAEVKAILGPDIPSQIVKVIDHIDAHCKAVPLYRDLERQCGRSHGHLAQR